jgi:hypothetical protein
MEFTEAGEVQAWVRNLIQTRNQQNDEAVLLYLENLITDLLQKRPNMLAQVLYRLDVDESKTNEAMKLSPDQWPKALGKLIFERELLRLAIWKRYSERNMNDLN